jgi:hypothetical protein
LEPNSYNIITVLQTEYSVNKIDDMDSLILQTDIKNGIENMENFQKITNIYFVGKFLKFNEKTRILDSESGKQFLLPINKIEKSKILIDKTKKILSKLV